tara:strand:+ start:3265 stop:3852 length:588 start_codon:yes stop_codon:yes gene_type:complete
MNNSLNDTYIFRLTNWSIAGDSSNTPVLDANNNEFTIKVPERLRAKGKCKVSVIGGEVLLELYGGASRITPNDARYLELESNIPYLGYSVETTGAGGAILIASAITDNTQVSVTPVLANTGATCFTCPVLPPQITCKKFYLNADNERVAAEAYTTKALPVEVLLQLEFFEDFNPPMVNRIHADRSANDHNNFMNT